MTRDCTECGLCKTRTQIVWGDGSYTAEVMFVGEAPGMHEDAEGRPFIGRAGKILTDMIRELGLTRKSVFITNIVKCRPPNNRDPRTEEIDACGHHLDEEIERVNPKFICTLGRFSGSYVLNKYGLSMGSMSQVHGLFYKTSDGIVIVPLYHPAALMYDRHKIPIMKKDLDKIKALL